jgi:hypothetical protein
MEKNPQKLLEDLIHRELSKLSEREAPSTLMPRVLAEIRARQEKRWWHRPWTDWSIALQLLSMPLLLGSLAGAMVLASFIWKLAVAHLSLDWLEARLGTLTGAWDLLGDLGNALLTLSRGVGQEWLLAAFLIPLSMYLVCVGLGTLCYRTATQTR